MKPFSFIHAADLHLDSPFRDLHVRVDDPSAKSRIRNATFTAFDNIINLCIHHRVDFILIAGDVFDSRHRSLRAQLAFRDGMQRLSGHGIRAFIVHGNHDPLEEESQVIKLPDSVHIFGQEKVEQQVFLKDDSPAAVIHGISYKKPAEKRNLARKFSSFGQPPAEKTADLQLGFAGGGQAGELFSIGLLHCNASGSREHEPYAPCSLKEDLIPAGIDYWALGHVHTRTVLNEKHPSVVYPGNIQGLHSRETGARGCCLISVDGSGEANIEFKPVDDVRWYSIEIDISTHDSPEDTVSAVERTLDGCSAESGERLSILRLTVKGCGLVHGHLHRPENEDWLITHAREAGFSLSPPVIVNEVRIETRRQIDIEKQRRADNFIGDFLKITDVIRREPAMRDRLRESLNSLYSRLARKKVTALPDDDELLAMLDQAESKCLDFLVGDDD